jgi:hypothetical protein
VVVADSTASLCCNSSCACCCLISANENELAGNKNKKLSTVSSTADKTNRNTTDLKV